MLLTVTGEVSKTVEWCGQTWNLPGDSGAQKSVCPDAYAKYDTTTSTVYNGYSWMFLVGEYWRNTAAGANKKLRLSRMGTIQYVGSEFYRNVISLTASTTTGTVRGFSRIYAGVYGPATTKNAYMETPPSVTGEAKATTGNYRITSKFFGTCTNNGVTLEWEQGLGW